MQETRLAVVSDEASREAIAARLHHAALTAIEECNAVLIADAVPQADIERLLAEGKHVCQFANTIATGEAMESLFIAARSRGMQVIFANPQRYLPSRQLIRKQIAVLGEPGMIRVHRWEPFAPSSESGLPSALFRDLDVVLWLAGASPERVYAVEQKAEGSGRYLQVHLGFPGGGMALLDFTNRLPAGDGYQSLSVIARSGAAHADDHTNTQLVYGSGSPRAVRTEENAGQLAAIAQEFVDGLRGGHDLMTANAAEWRQVFALANAIAKSLATGRSTTPEDR